MRPETIARLAETVGGSVSGDGGVSVSDATHDSRQAGEETLFVAVVGSRQDGHAFVDDVVRAGSPAVCVSRPVETTATVLMVEDTRRAMGPVAASIHGHPSRSVPVVGVTGTNGKTTVTHYTESILSVSGHNPGLIGTVATRLGDRVFPSERTTPEATDFQRLLASMRDDGADAIAAEVSSHALEMGRVAGTEFAVAAFTNLTQDHLDFHGDMRSYGQAKRRLFTDYEVGHAVINVADGFGSRLAAELDGPMTTVGPEGDISAENLRYTSEGTKFTLRLGAARREVSTPLIGSFNVENSLVATGCCLALGLESDAIVAAFASMRGVPGRFEIVSEDNPVRVIVDYAHTPDSIAAAIASARRLTRSEVIALVGAGGDRDREKRARMGSAAAGADIVVITSDNPRSEDPGVIIDAIAAGVPADSKVVIEPDREHAISKAIDMAAPDDIVLVLGKGHETGQEVAGVLHPFVDRDVVRSLLGLESTGPGQQSGSISP